MNCDHCQELLHARERGELPGEMHAALATHLRGCADCTRADLALRELNELLDAEVVASPGLRRQVLARLEQDVALRGIPATAFGAWFTRLWPSRPLGAFSYSLALVLCGMFGGQLLPGAFGNDPAARPALYQLCPVPDGPGTPIL
ncbi:MAG: anti-sigma factor family protein [Gammaproteobacteria bacterium]